MHPITWDYNHIYQIFIPFGKFVWIAHKISEEEGRYSVPLRRNVNDQKDLPYVGAEINIITLGILKVNGFTLYAFNSQFADEV